jgi:spore germination protein GerM
MNRNKAILTGLAFFALLLLGTIGGYFIFTSGIQKAGKQITVKPAEEDIEYTYLKIYYPYNNRLNMEDRRVPRTDSRIGAADSTVLEFLKGPAGVTESYVPEGAELLGIYPGEDGILYIDLSESVRNNFQGDALAEFLFLRGLYESILSNVYGVEGVKLLIEGQEADSIGGHISIARALDEIVSYTIAEENESK